MCSLLFRFLLHCQVRYIPEGNDAAATDQRRFAYSNAATGTIQWDFPTADNSS